MKRKRLRWIASGLALAIAIATAIVICARAAAVPVRHFADSSWFFHERQRPTVVRFTPDAQTQHAIKRAQIDYFVAPILEGRRLIHFDYAWRVEPDDLYLVFGNGDTHLFIIYRCKREDGRLLWKATEFQSF